MVYPKSTYFHQIFVQLDSVTGAQPEKCQGKGPIYENWHTAMFSKKM